MSTQIPSCPRFRMPRPPRSRGTRHPEPSSTRSPATRERRTDSRSGASSAARLFARGRRPSWTLVAAIAVIAIAVLWAVVPWLFTSYDPINGVPADKLLPPSAAHWFGTDAIGRDLYARVVYGAIHSLSGALIAVTVGLAAGTRHRRPRGLGRRVDRRHADAHRRRAAVDPGAPADAVDHHPAGVRHGERRDRGRRRERRVVRPAVAVGGGARAAHATTSRRRSAAAAPSPPCWAGTCCPTR